MSAYQEAFARIEKKFFVTGEQHAALVEALRRQGFALQLFGSATVQSIYYDTPDCLLARRSIARPNYKEKLRLRTYGSVSADSTAFLEIKKKYQHVVYKRRTSLPLPQAVSALNRGCLPEENGQIGREISRFVQHYGVQPAALIAYERDAWLNSAADAVRITFDSRIRFRGSRLDLTLPGEGTLLVPPALRLMEVKVPGAWPLWLTHLLWQLDVQPTHFSKYGTAYQQYLSRGLCAADHPEVIRCA